MRAILTLRGKQKPSLGILAQTKSKLEVPLWENIPPNIPDYVGFVYKLTHLPTGRHYIGKKLFYKSAGKKKGRLMRDVSDWRKYWSSSKDIQALIKEEGTQNFRREILACYKTKGELMIGELAYQLMHINSPLSMNGILNVRTFIGKDIRKMVMPWDQKPSGSEPISS